MDSNTKKLDQGDKHFLRLIVQGRKPDGWTPVSSVVYPLVEKMPKELVELEQVGSDGAGRVQLTQQGQDIFDAMAWL